ncbi:uncharacterized protein TNCT_549681 [Trichonephila clavata]|uniref:Uncharacterized protein n=1 Tax=Trichonephila clavata TaxID=2740835 RepID=A0A8X6LK95_TRICU|nr:uncharacterized protein TNCT_127331 [Trichonephila clavata]GFR06004.1 uncharacterized protein TNCT_131011 [Trichonephila clavata]GFR06345.1 uncharacterized protein TNCT_415871 [Trichonephila clavata]GFR07317.1 uncharacterized protein TNCT_562241 [Trichonephila clavata]GFR12910.1 uncharacterized protein TNCT_328041 [Trichonephila clavata]
MERKGRVFTLDQMQTIHTRVEKLKDTEEMALLVFLLLKTKLKMSDLLSWFNTDPKKRQDYLKEHAEWLEDYASVPVLFPKTHQAYLNQWKRLCSNLFGVHQATFEMLKRSQKLYKG